MSKVKEEYMDYDGVTLDRNSYEYLMNRCKKLEQQNKEMIVKKDKVKNISKLLRKKTRDIINSLVKYDNFDCLIELQSIKRSIDEQIRIINE